MHGVTHEKATKGESRVHARYDVMCKGREVSLTSSKDAYNMRIHTMDINLFFVATDHGKRW